MNEVELIYHYSQEEFEDFLKEVASEHENGNLKLKVKDFKDVLEAYELEIKLNGVTVKRGDHCHDKIFDFKEGFMLACTKLLTFYSTKKTHIADLDY